MTLKIGFFPKKVIRKFGPRNYFCPPNSVPIESTPMIGT